MNLNFFQFSVPAFLLVSFVFTCPNFKFILGELPSLPELLDLNLPEEVGTNHFVFGVLILDDKTGNRVDIIQNECFGKPEKVTCRILQEWVLGKGVPVTWESLVDILRKIGRVVLADKIASIKLHTCAQ